MKLINPFKLNKDESILFDKPTINESGKVFKIINITNVVILQKVCPTRFGTGDILGFDVFQIELPTQGVGWLVDAIENKFWTSADLGGLPSGTYQYKETVKGEKLALYREMNVGDKNQKGFRLTNFSRPSRTYEDDNYQDFFITDIMLLEGGLLNALKQL